MPKTRNPTAKHCHRQPWQQIYAQIDRKTEVVSIINASINWNTSRLHHLHVLQKPQLFEEIMGIKAPWLLVNRMYRPIDVFKIIPIFLKHASVSSKRWRRVLCEESSDISYWTTWMTSPSSRRIFNRKTFAVPLPLDDVVQIGFGILLTKVNTAKD